MKRTIINKYLGALAILFALATTVSMAQCPRGGKGPGPKYGAGAGNGKAYTYQNIPDLTEEQKLKIDKIILEQKKEMLETRAQLDVKRAKLKTLLTEDNTDKATIDALIDEMSKIRADMQKEHAANVIEIRKLLTEEQKVYYDTHLISRGFGYRAEGGRRMGRKGQ